VPPLTCYEVTLTFTFTNYFGFKEVDGFKSDKKKLNIRGTSNFGVDTQI
jgi:hypothetical protein